MAHSQTQSIFFTLPVEIRQSIYEECALVALEEVRAVNPLFVHDYTSSIRNGARAAGSPYERLCTRLPDLLKTCKRVAQEATFIMLQNASLEIGADFGASTLPCLRLRVLGRFDQNLVRNLSIVLQLGAHLQRYGYAFPSMQGQLEALFVNALNVQRVDIKLDMKLQWNVPADEKEKVVSVLEGPLRIIVRVLKTLPSLREVKISGHYQKASLEWIEMELGVKAIAGPMKECYVEKNEWEENEEESEEEESEEEESEAEESEAEGPERATQFNV